MDLAPRPSPAAEAFVEKLRLAVASYPVASEYLVGVSGGGDSVALLHGLVALGYRQLVVCHLDHGLRGEESAGDAEFVRTLAEKLGLPCESTRIDVAGRARERRSSVETAAREARYAWFAEIVRRRGMAAAVLLGHHADDQAETFLFNLLRGAGPVGLAGISPARERLVDGVTLRIIRPMLGIWREEIAVFRAARGLAWREDRSNADPATATRNAIRAEVLPLLARVMRRDVRGALCRTAEIVRAEESCLEAQVSIAGKADAERLAVAPLRAEHLAIQRRHIRRWLQARAIPNVGYEEVERVRTLLAPTGQAPAKVNLPGGHHVRRRSGWLFVEAGGNQPRAPGDQ